MSLSKPRSYQLPGFDLPDPPWIVGHRGAAGVAPENTLASIEVALAQGADMIEIDLHLTRDRHLVASHDADLERRSGQPGVISELNVEELGQYEVGDPDERESLAHKIPTLSQVLAALPETFPINLEIKVSESRPGDIIDALLHDVGARTNILVSSFDWSLLASLRARHSLVPIAPIARQDAQALLLAGKKLDASTLHCHHAMVDSTFIDRATTDRRPVLAYTVNDAAEAERLIEVGVSGFFTDFPERLRNELGLSV